jgi:hypothetical protein
VFCIVERGDGGPGRNDVHTPKAGTRPARAVCVAAMAH